MQFRALHAADFQLVHRTFLRAFDDYEIPVHLSADELRRLLARRGAELGLSVGAFDGEDMVAVMAVAMDTYEEIVTAYDVFTGVIPSHRGRGLAGQLFDAALPALIECGARRFLLEVIQSNDAAVRAYERAGFAIRRDFRCYEVDTDRVDSLEPGSGIKIVPGHFADIEEYGEWRDWMPSWQNSDNAIRRALDEPVLLEAHVDSTPVGYAVVMLQARDVAQLVVHDSHRRRGVGSALLRAAHDSVDNCHF